jgi:hypothetical protein
MGTLSTSDETALVDNSALEGHGCKKTLLAPLVQHQTLRAVREIQQTFDFLPLLVAHEPGHLHCITNKGIATRMMYSSLNSRLILHNIDSQPRSFGKRPELVVDGLSLDGVERDESCLAGALVAHVLSDIRMSLGERENENEWDAHLDTVNSRLLFIHNNGVDISTENDRHSDLVLPLNRLAEVNDTSTNTWKSPASVAVPLIQKTMAYQGKFFANLPGFLSISPPFQTRPCPRQLVRAHGKSSGVFRRFLPRASY